MVQPLITSDNRKIFDYVRQRSNRNSFVNDILHDVSKIPIELECGPLLNVMAALPNINGAVCSTPQSLADAHYSSAVQ